MEPGRGPGEPADLPVPTGLAIAQYGSDYLLQWDPAADPRVAGYNVYRSFLTSPKIRQGKLLNKALLQSTSFFETSVNNLYLSDTPGRPGRRLNSRPVRDTFFFAEGVPAGTGRHYLTVRSVDTTGNESAAVQAVPEPVPFRFYEEDSPDIVYGGLWKRERYPEAHEGAVTVANDAGAYAELTFTGRSIKVYSANYWTCGETDIYIDGALVATVDQYADATRYGVLTYRNYALRPGTHVIRIVATGRSSRAEQVPGYHFSNWDYLQVH